jgi:hypothetical protein
MMPTEITNDLPTSDLGSTLLKTSRARCMVCEREAGRGQERMRGEVLERCGSLRI